jgi:hypothetical protein
MSSRAKPRPEPAAPPPPLRMLSIGYGNLVSAARVIAIVSPSPRR